MIKFQKLQNLKLSFLFASNNLIKDVDIRDWNFKKETGY